MDINEIRAMTGKLVTLQLRTPWLALMYQSDPRAKAGAELASTLAVHTDPQSGSVEAYGPQQFLANVQVEVRTTEKRVLEGVQDTITEIEHVVVLQRGPDGSMMEILCPPEEITYITRIADKPPEQGRIIAP